MYSGLFGKLILPFHRGSGHNDPARVAVFQERAFDEAGPLSAGEVEVVVAVAIQVAKQHARLHDWWQLSVESGGKR